LILAAALAFGCAHDAPPPDRVVQEDIGDWAYRRFQKVEDIEIVLPGNPGVGFTAVYQRRETVGKPQVGRSDLAVAFVTEYEHAQGLAGEIAERVHKLEGYKVKADKRGGVKVLVLTGDGDAWAFWPSRNFLVKVGGPETRDPPTPLIKAYGALYPSDLP
jgi:hypothetical protein